MSARSVPRYQQLKTLIIEQISSGELKPADRVPSENELVDATGVSRMTANRALKELNEEGYVERIAGVGTFVADFRAASHVLEVRNIADEIAARGHTHTLRITARGVRRADEETAAALDLEPGDELSFVRAIHAENGIPIQREDRFVLRDVAPGFADERFSDTTPSAYLSAIAPLQEAEQSVRAIAVPGDVRRDLDMERDEPCLLVTRRTWVRRRPVTFARLYHPGSRYELAGHYAPPGYARAAEGKTT